MKIMITLNSHADLALCLPADKAAAAAELLSQAEVFKPENAYSSNPTWEKAETDLRIRYVDDAMLQAPDPKLIKAQQESERNNSRWLEEYTKRQALEKTVATLEAKVSALLAVPACTKATDVERSDSAEEVAA